MPVRLLNFKMEESDIHEMKKVASVFNKEAVREYIAKMKKGPFYRLTANVEEATADEFAEVLGEIEGLSDDDLSIASVKRFDV